MAGDGRRRVGFFGPFGTFAEQALHTQPDLDAAEAVPFPTVPDVLDAVVAGDVECGVVPIENSIEGVVNFTQDALSFDYDLLIAREIVLDIELCWWRSPGLRSTTSRSCCRSRWQRRSATASCASGSPGSNRTPPTARPKRHGWSPTTTGPARPSHRGSPRPGTGST